MLPYPISHIIENVFFIPVILICSGEHMEAERIKTRNIQQNNNESKL